MEEKIDYEERIHDQIRYMINWLETNELRHYRHERLRRYSGIEILLYILDWFPDGILPFKQVEDEHQFLFWKRSYTRRETYEELFIRLIKEYKEKHQLQ